MSSKEKINENFDEKSDINKNSVTPTISISNYDDNANNNLDNSVQDIDSDQDSDSESDDDFEKLEADNFNKYKLFGNHERYYQRQFCNAPTFDTPNEQSSFAKWLYEAPKTCKENSMYCLKYEDVRFNRYNPDIDKSEEFDID